MIFKKNDVASFLGINNQAVNTQALQLMNYDEANVSIDRYNKALKDNIIAQEEWNSILQQSDTILTKYLSDMDRLKSKATYEGYKGYFAGSNITPVGISGVNNAIKEYKKVSVQGADATKGFIAAISSQNQSLANYLTNLNGAKAGLLGYGMSLIGATVKSIGLTVATTALNTVLTMGISTVITGIIAIVGDLIDSMIQTEEEIREIKNAAKDAETEIKNLSDNFNKLKKNTDDVKKRFAELAQGVENLGQVNQNRGKLSDDDYKEFLEISNQLSELFPELTVGYDDNGNAILNLSGNVDTIVGSLNNLVNVNQQLANQKIEDELPKLLEGRKVALEEYNKKLKETEKNSETLKSFQAGIKLGKSFFKDKDELFDFNDFLKNQGIEFSVYDLFDKGAITSDGREISYNHEALKYQKNLTIDWSKLSDTEITEIQKYFGSLSNQFEKESNQYEDSIKSYNKKVQNNISQVLLSDSNATYSILSEKQKELASVIFTNTDWLSLVPDDVDTNDLESLKDWLEDNILSQIYKIDDKKIQNSFKKAISGKLSLNDLIDLKDIFTSDISENGLGLDENNPIVIYLQTKIDNKQNQENAMKKSIEDISNGNEKTQKELSNFTKGFTDEQQELWLKVTSKATNAAEAVRNYEKALKRANSTKFTKTFENIQEDIGNIQTLQNVVENFKTNLDFNTSDLDSLLKAYPELTENVRKYYAQEISAQDLFDILTKKEKEYTDKYKSDMRMLSAINNETLQNWAKDNDEDLSYFSNIQELKNDVLEDTLSDISKATGENINNLKKQYEQDGKNFVANEKLKLNALMKTYIAQKSQYSPMEWVQLMANMSKAYKDLNALDIAFDIENNDPVIPKDKSESDKDSAPHRDETNNNYYDYYSAMLEDKEKALEKFTKGNEKLDELFQKAVNRGDTEAMNNIIEQRKANNDAYQKALNNSVNSTAKSQQDALKRLYAIAPEFRGMSIEQIVGNKQLQTTVDKRFDDALVSNSNAQYKAEQGKDWTKKAGLEDTAKALNQNKSEVSSIISFLENSSNDIESWNSALNNSYKETADSIKSMYDQMLGFNEDKRAKFEMIDGSEQEQIDTLKDDLNILAKEKQDLLNIKDNNGESVFTEQSEEVRELDNRVREALKDIYALNDEIFGRKIDRNETDISRLENTYGSEEAIRQIILKNKELYHLQAEDLRNRKDANGNLLYNEDSPEILELQDKYMDSLRKFYDTYMQEHERRQEEISDRIGTIDFKIDITDSADYSTKSALLVEKTHLIKDSLWNVEQQKRRLDEQFANNKSSTQYVEAMKSLTKESQELYKELGNVYDSEKQLQQERANTIKETEDKVIEMLEDKYKKIKDNYQKRINLEKEYIDNRKDLLNKLLDSYEKKWKAEDEDEKRQDKLKDREKLSKKRNDLAGAAASGDLEALSQMEDLDEQISDMDKDLANDSKENYRQSVRDRIKDEIDSLDDLSKQYDKDLENFNALIDQKLERENLYAEAHKDIIEGTFTDAYGRVISLSEAFDQYMKENGNGFSWLAEVDLSNFNESLIDTNNNLKDLKDIMGQISELGVREFLESLGYEVGWDNETKDVIVNGKRINQEKFGNNRANDGKLVGTSAQILKTLDDEVLGKYNVFPQDNITNANTKQALQYDKDNIKMPDYNEKGYDMNMTVEGFKKALEGTDTAKFTASFKESLNDSILKDIHNEMKNLTGKGVSAKVTTKESKDGKIISQSISSEKFKSKNEEEWKTVNLSDLNSVLPNITTGIQSLIGSMASIKDAFTKNIELINNKPANINIDSSVTVQGNLDNMTRKDVENIIATNTGNIAKNMAKVFNNTLSNNGTIGRIMR